MHKKLCKGKHKQFAASAALSASGLYVLMRLGSKWLRSAVVASAASAFCCTVAMSCMPATKLKQHQGSYQVPMPASDQCNSTAVGVLYQNAVLSDSDKNIFTSTEQPHLHAGNCLSGTGLGTTQLHLFYRRKAHDCLPWESTLTLAGSKRLPLTCSCD